MVKEIKALFTKISKSKKLLFIRKSL